MFELNWGIKKFLRKFIFRIGYPNLSFDVFPKKGVWSFFVDRYLDRDEKEFYRVRKKNIVGDMISYPSKYVQGIVNRFLKYNPNNHGNWSGKKKNNFYGSGEIESKLVKTMVDLYGGKQERWEGYMSSGGTEGNIFASWVGRKYLRERVGKYKCSMVVCSLTHHSVIKAADIVGMDLVNVAINSKTWTIDIDCLINEIEKYYFQGIRGFSICLTWGYTVCGSKDEFIKVEKQIKKLKKKLKGLEVFIWIDAALSGLVSPFVESEFKPLMNGGLIKIFVTDFHKCFGTPYPSGLVLYDRTLRKLFEKRIEYLPIMDATLIGSRSGVAPIVVWAMIKKLGFDGLKQKIEEAIKKKDDFLTLFEKKFEDICVMTDDFSINACVIVKNKLPKDFCEKYGLYICHQPIKFSKGKEDVLYYKLIFMPQWD